MGKELFRVEDKYGLVLVTQHGDKRVLSFGSNLEQSSVYMSRQYYLSHEYTQIMLLGFLFVEAKNITILGLGGGGLVHCLLRFFPQCEIKVAELRQSVIDIDYDWFELPKIEKLKIYHADAYDYLQTQGRESADLIMSDLYVAEDGYLYCSWSRFNLPIVAIRDDTYMLGSKNHDYENEDDIDNIF